MQRCVFFAAVMAVLGRGRAVVNYGATSDAARRFADATRLRVLAMSRAVVVVEKPSGLRSVPAFGPTAALVAAHADAVAAAGGPSAAVDAAFERPTRRERWNAVASRCEALPPSVRARAGSLPRTHDKFVKFAAGPAGGRLGPAAASAAYRALKAAVLAAEAAEGMEESDSVLRRAQRDAHWTEACSVHRLDYATSGCLAVALNSRAAADLSAQWRKPGQEKGDSTSLQRECSARARFGNSTHASRALREMIARPKISRNERKTTEIGAFEVGNFAPFCCPGGSGP